MTLLDRSLSLCQLVYDRRADNEVGFEIRRLLVEGVDINVQDLNRNGNTPLHLAVQKSDMKCVEVLLQYKPNLQIRNSKGKTAADLAGNIEIYEKLKAINFSGIRKEFVYEIEFKDLSIEKIEILRKESTFKALKLLNCPSIHVTCEKIIEICFPGAINTSSHLFVIVIEINDAGSEAESENKSEVLGKLFKLKRPVIIEIASIATEESCIYYKEENSQRLFEINMSLPIERAELMEKIQSRKDCTFTLLTQALHSNLIGTLNGSLLNSKLRNDEDRSEISNYFVEHNELCSRFLKLFNEILTEKELVDRAESTLQHNGDQSLLALLDLPFQLKESAVKLTDDQNRILDARNSRGYNLLMIAIGWRNLDSIKLLLRCGNSIHHVGSDNKRAADICWDEQYWECLALLIKAGSPYPEDFDGSLMAFATSESFDGIKTSTDAATSFHDFIKKGDITKLKDFIANNPTQLNVYDRTNKSALTVALESNQAEIYSLLLSKGFSPGADREYENSLRKFSDKSVIRRSNNMYFKKAFDQPHLKILLDKYRLSFSSENRESCLQSINEMFFKLNEIPEMIPILQIVSCSEASVIVFDFTCPSIVAMDPTANFCTAGRTYHNEGFIYVGAGNYKEDFYGVVGTLAHELTHFAMKLTYDSSCRPYANDDMVNKAIFETITQDTKILCEKSLTNPIIENVFRYQDTLWHQELIVRVPELLANQKNEVNALRQIRCKHFQLFDFFSTKVLKDVELQSKFLINQLSIKKINHRMGTLNKIKQLKVDFENLQTVDNSDQIIATNAPQLTLAMLNQSLDRASSAIFVTIEQVTNENLCEIVNKIDESFKYSIIIDCANMTRKYSEIICKLRERFMKNCVIMLVVSENENTTANFKRTHIEHHWRDLTENSQKSLLDKFVYFQGVRMKLNELTSTVNSTAALENLPLHEFMNSENFHIGSPLPIPDHKFYIPRWLLIRTQRNYKSNAPISHSGPRSEKYIISHLNLKDFVKDSPSIVIISDSPGSGKTSVLHEIARNLLSANYLRWILIVDLKQYIEKFKMPRENENNSLQDFITQNILIEEPLSVKKLFVQFYQEGRTNILLDGYDEISPHYKNKILEALKTFKPGGNQLWITTRTHLEQELENILNQLSCSLKPLRKEAQIEFLIETWKSTRPSNCIEEDLLTIASNLIKKISTVSTSISTFIGSPILISMLAEIYDDPTKRESLTTSEELSFYLIFERFVGKNIQTWMSKGKIYEIEQHEINLQSDGIIEVHQKIALAYFFRNDISITDVNFDNSDWNFEKLSRLGLARFDHTTGMFLFNHETLAEYFLINYIVKHFKNKSKRQCVLEILLYVLCDKKFQVARLLLDQSLKYLKFNIDEASCIAAGNILNNVLIQRETYGLLLNSSKELRHELLKFTILLLKHFGKDNLKKVLIAVDEDDESNIFHRVSENKAEDIFSVLQEYTSKALTAMELKKMLLAKDIFGCDALHHAVKCCNETSFKGFLGLLIQTLSHNEVKEKIFEVNSNGDSLLHSALIHNDKITLQVIFEAIRKLMNIDDLMKLLQQKGFGERNIFHVVCKNENEELFPTLLKLTTNLIRSDDIKKMLKEKDSDGFNVFNLVAALGNYNAIKGLLQILTDLFRKDEIKEQIFDVNDGGESFLHSALTRNSKMALEILFEFIDALLSVGYLKKLLQQKGFRERNIFHRAGGNTSQNIFPTLLSMAGKFIDATEIKAMLKEKDSDGFNVLDITAAFGNYKAINGLLEILKQLLSYKELKELVFEIRPHRLSSIYQFIMELLSFEDTKDLFERARYNEQKNSIHQAIESENSRLFPSFLESISNSSQDQIKEMLKIKDIHLRSVLHRVASSGDRNALISLLKILKTVLFYDEVDELMFDIDEDGNNFLHLAVRRNNKRSLESLFKFIRKLLNADDFRELIQRRGFQRKNIFHLACENQSAFIFPTLVKHAAQLLATNEIEAMLTEADDESWTVLHLAGAFEFVSENALRSLAKLLQQMLSSDEIKDLMFKVDGDGDNFLHSAVLQNNKNALESVFKVIEKLLNVEDIKELLIQRGFMKRNLFHRASENTNPEIFSTLIKHAFKVLTTDEIKTLLEQKDSSGQNVLHLARSEDEVTLTDIFQRLQYFLNDTESAKVSLENNCLLLAAAPCNSKLIEGFCDFIKYTLHLKVRENSYQAAENVDKNIIFLNIKPTQKVLTDSEIKNLLQEPSNVLNIFLYLAKHQDEEALLEILLTLQGYLNNDTLKMLSLRRSIVLTNVCHLLTKDIRSLKFIEISQNIIEAGLNFSLEELEDLLSCSWSLDTRSKLWATFRRFFDCDE